MSKLLRRNRKTDLGVLTQAAYFPDQNWTDLMEWRLPEGPGPLYERLCMLLREKIFINALPHGTMGCCRFRGHRPNFHVAGRRPG